MYKCLTVLLLEYVVIWQMTLVCIDWRVVTLMAFMNYAALWTLCSKAGDTCGHSPNILWRGSLSDNDFHRAWSP